MVDKHLRSKTWYVTIRYLYSTKDDYVVKVEALSKQDAMLMAVPNKMRSRHYILAVAQMKPTKNGAPPRNRTGISALRKRRSRPLDQKGKKKNAFR